MAEGDSAGLDIDWAFISKLEGGQQLVGKVINPKTSKSGVTIATGFDLGWHSRADLERLMLPRQLIDKLTPYCTLRRGEAVEYLRLHPLQITVAEATTIDRAKMPQVAQLLEVRYNADSPVPLASLPRNAQTVIASVEYHYGSIRHKRPAFWRLVTQQQWKAATDMLRHMDGFTGRRKKEANLLASLSTPAESNGDDALSTFWTQDMNDL